MDNFFKSTYGKRTMARRMSWQGPPPKRARYSNAGARGIPVISTFGIRRTMPARRWNRGTLKNMRQGGFVGQELKYFDTSNILDALVAPTDAAGGEVDPGTLLTLCCPVQGSGATNRDGRRIVMKSIQLSGSIITAPNPDEADMPAQAQYFVALVQDTQTNAAQLSSEDVFANPGANAATAANPFRDLERSTRFKVLKSWYLKQPMLTSLNDAAATGSVSGSAVRFSYYSKLSIPVEFVANAGTVADVQDNSLHLIAYTNSTGLAPSISYNCRVRFVG